MANRLADSNCAFSPLIFCVEINSQSSQLPFRPLLMESAIEEREAMN
uniref:Uncharacterized protein n=1 Tax=Rhizobium leguminosarum bv. viciae TaxID=387 RepID=A0A0U3ATY9_RHILV|nr:hypothetical protein [Rhizobium leguminosarum bv. viciae]